MSEIEDDMEKYVESFLYWSSGQDGMLVLYEFFVFGINWASFKIF